MVRHFDGNVQFIQKSVLPIFFFLISFGQSWAAQMQLQNIITNLFKQMSNVIFCVFHSFSKHAYALHILVMQVIHTQHVKFSRMSTLL